MFTLDHPKLQTLADYEGYSDTLDFLEANSLDSVVPAICINAGCDAVADMEPDQDRGYCEACGTQTMKSGLILAGLI